MSLKGKHPSALTNNVQTSQYDIRGVYSTFCWDTRFHRRYKIIEVKFSFIIRPKTGDSQSQTY